MKGAPPAMVLNNIKLMYPKLFERKGQKWTTELLANIRLAQKAIVKGDVPAYNAIMDSAYGKSAQPIGHSGEVEVKMKAIEDLTESIKQLAEK